MRRSAPIALLAMSFLAAAVPRTQVGAQVQTPQVKESKPGLLRQATVTPDMATRTALQQVPNGLIQDVEIEREKGKLVYSYDIKVAGRAGTDEVLVDAKTGAVVSHTHESPAAEAAEARRDARAAQKGGAGTPSRPR